MKFQNKYRIVKDNYAGYEAQFQYWWFPFIWIQCDSVNTSSSIEQAERICREHAASGDVIKEYDPYS